MTNGPVTDESEEIKHARAAVIDAMLYAGKVIMENLDGASDADRAEADRALEEFNLRIAALYMLLEEAQ